MQHRRVICFVMLYPGPRSAAHVTADLGRQNDFTSTEIQYLRANLEPHKIAILSKLLRSIIGQKKHYWSNVQKCRNVKIENFEHRQVCSTYVYLCL